MGVNDPNCHDDTHGSQTTARPSPSLTPTPDYGQRNPASTAPHQPHTRGSFDHTQSRPRQTPLYTGTRSNRPPFATIPTIATTAEAAKTAPTTPVAPVAPSVSITPIAPIAPILSIVPTLAVHSQSNPSLLRSSRDDQQLRGNFGHSACLGSSTSQIAAVPVLSVESEHPTSLHSPTIDGVEFQTALAGIDQALFSLADRHSTDSRKPIDSIRLAIADRLSPMPPYYNYHDGRRPRPGSPDRIPQFRDWPEEEERHRDFSRIPSNKIRPPPPDAAPICGTPPSNMPSAGQPNSRHRGRDHSPFRPRLSINLPGSSFLDHEYAVRPPEANTARNRPVSHLSRTGTMIRHMSQRIVNLANEDDIVRRPKHRQQGYRHRSYAYPNDSSKNAMEMTDMTSYIAADAWSDDTVIGDRPLEKPSKFNMYDSPKQPYKPAYSPVTNPFRGKSLGMFSPDNFVRRKLCDLLLCQATEPFVFVLITVHMVFLAIDSNRTVEYGNPETFAFGLHWVDYGLLALFIVYTIELLIRMIVSGFLLNPVEYSSIDRKIGWAKALRIKAQILFGTPYTRPPQLMHGLPNQSNHYQQSFVQSIKSNPELYHGDLRQKQRARLAHRAFLRHSFNRLDFIAVCSYWISLVLELHLLSHGRYFSAFRMLSGLRILRLLYLTSGTAVILSSLKKAAPLLLNIAFLIGFFWLLFSIIAVQSFKSSFRRQCVWINPEDRTDNWTNALQFCGGQLDNVTGQPRPWGRINDETFVPATRAHKGFLCPQQSWCIENGNPNNGSVSFDNIFASLELVFVLMSSNTFSDLMYGLMDSDFLPAALFFAVGIFILVFWLVSLLIAVITTSFDVIRQESQSSAFTNGNDVDSEASPTQANMLAPSSMNTIKQTFAKTKRIWLIIILIGLLVQALKTPEMSDSKRDAIAWTETIVTLALAIEILIRLLLGWRTFFRSKRDVTDLIIAIVTVVIQLPPIYNSGTPYAWLTFFQIVRIYRVVLAVPLTRDLIMTTLGNVSGLLNLTLFVFLFTFLASILAAQIFRGSIPEVDPSNNETYQIQFNTLWASFLAMYQVLSSENWTSILYLVTDFDIYYGTSWMASCFFILWFIVGNFIALNLFIAVIQENFDVSEDEKRLQQVKAFLEQREAGSQASLGSLSLFQLFSYGSHNERQQDPQRFESSMATKMLLKDAVVRDFLDQSQDQTTLQGSYSDIDEPKYQHQRLRPDPTAFSRYGSPFAFWRKILAYFRSKEPNPFYSRLQFSKDNDEFDPAQMAKAVMSAERRRKFLQREYLRNHPNYNVSLYIFPPNCFIRRWCQKIVSPGRGTTRIEGVMPSAPLWYAWAAFIYAVIFCMVIVACITTPMYLMEYFQTHDFDVGDWFVWSTIAFAVIFSLEAIIKVIADGVFMTPNAYYRSTWGFIDGIVLITLWLDVIALMYHAGKVSRFIGIFKAFRALRLLNISNSTRDNFHAVVVRGAFKVFAVAAVSISLFIPFAIYGVNLFANKMKSCNDGDLENPDLNNCMGEYPKNSPFNWNIYSPRVVSNPWFNFDDFSTSLFVLFTIASLEGWIDMAKSAENITGVFSQPKVFASRGNGIFFVLFNLLGCVFVMTLFVSVFMRNYTEMTGVAFLTSDQRSWLELRKLLQHISPSKRPVNGDLHAGIMKTIYRLAVQKNGAWQQFVTWVLMFHLLLLCLEFYPVNQAWEFTRNLLFLACTFVYASNIFIRILGLTWSRFARSSWNLYSIFSVTGTLITTVAFLVAPQRSIMWRLNKIFQVSNVLLLIPRNDQLDQLTKTAGASLPHIGNLFATWFVLFLVFAIAMTQAFGLTRFGSKGTGNLNCRNVPKALILLFRMSMGEGWNELMEDYAGINPPLCVDNGPFDTDCGGTGSARFLFIAWNVISLYIFVNLFISLIYESFSYVYQKSSGLAVVNRDEIRRFKEAWAVVDPDGTGYIPEKHLTKLLRELSGVFEMRIYDGDYTVKSLLDHCAREPRSVSAFSDTPNYNAKPIVDLARLNERLRSLPVREVRRRRRQLERFYEEMLTCAIPNRGIRFSTVIITLAHYKVINDNRSLRLSEFLHRRARLQRIDEEIRRKVVIGFFDLLYWRQYLESHKNGRQGGAVRGAPQSNMAKINADYQTGDGNLHREPSGLKRYMSIGAKAASSRGGTRNKSTPEPPSRGEEFTDSTSAGLPLNRTNSRQVRFNQQSNGERQAPTHLTPYYSSSLSRSNSNWRDREGKGRPESEVSVQDVLDAFDQSAWGESLRRSFTTNRGRSLYGGPGRQAQDERLLRDTSTDLEWRAGTTNRRLPEGSRY